MTASRQNAAADVPPPPKPKPGKPASEPLPDSPEWLPAETWQAFIEHRQAKRIPLTASSATLTLKHLDKARGFGHDPATLIETTITSNWTGCVFPEKHFQPAATAKPHNGQRYAPHKPPQAMTPEEAEWDLIMKNLTGTRQVIEGKCYASH